jgi:hypothetical protein
MWLHIPRASDAPLSNLPSSAQGCKMLSLQHHNTTNLDEEAEMHTEKNKHRSSVTITRRDLELFQKLNASGWLMTGQVRNYFFAGKSMRVVCKRLRQLCTTGYIAMARTSATEPALYRLASRGRLALIERTTLGEEDITIPKQLPRKIDHFTAINDLRFHFEQLSNGHNAKLLFFFSERELCRYYQNSRIGSYALLLLLKRHGIIPDAIAKIRINRQLLIQEMSVALEYDAGTERTAFFGRTKVKQYTALFGQNHNRLEDFKVLTFVPSLKRIISLMRQTVFLQAPPHLFYFAPIEHLRQNEWEVKEGFLDPYDFFVLIRRNDRIEVVEKEFHTGAVPKHALTALQGACSHKGFSRENPETQDKLLHIANLSLPS